MADFLNKTGAQRLWQKIKAYIDSKVYTAPAIVTDGYWQYRINDDNTYEAWYMRSGVYFDIKYASGNFYRSDPYTFALPTALQSGTVQNVQAQIFHANFPVFGAVASLNPPKVQALSGANRGSQSCTAVLYVFGTI